MSRIMLQRGNFLPITAVAILLIAVAGPLRAEPGTLEQFNRAMHEFNQKYYAPGGSEANQFFAENIPVDIRKGFSNFFANMGEPVVAVSSLAQGDVDNAEVAARRFFYNLVYGYGGVVDRASEAGVKAEHRDMGQAVCSIGIPDGPFVVIPFYGPSTVGDFVGSVLPTLAGYVALGEVFWVYRASSRVASTMADKEGSDDKTASTSAGDDTALERAYQVDKEHYLAARAAACQRRMLGQHDSDDPQFADVPR